ncbi:hypothetical protein QJS10_CPB15g00333 [Acorus calamus]|uniref:glutathione transferase n=1 Tax=Acorus calamus TaxID=4465 RepID=A0AAV9D468_ACOCL|nr:hypothetical protein QJS10_CPB15g00333 [Acorus calamus]
MASINVFGSPTSTEVSRVLACLFEKEAEFQLIRIDLYNGLQRQKCESESRKICRHISERFAEQGNKALLGRGTLERAAIEQWLQAEQQTFDPPIASLVFHLAFAPQPSYAEEEVQKEEARLSKVLDSYDRTLDKSRFLAGEEFTLADLSHLPNSHYLVNMTEKAYLFRERKNVWRWWEEISSRPSWKKVVRIQEEPPVMPCK